MSWRVSVRGKPSDVAEVMSKAIHESIEGVHSPDGYEASIAHGVAHAAGQMVRQIGHNLVQGDVAKQEEVYTSEHAVWRDKVEKARADYDKKHPAGMVRVHGDEFVAPPEPRYVEAVRREIVATSAGTVQDPGGKTSLTIVVSLAPEG